MKYIFSFLAVLIILSCKKENNVSPQTLLTKYNWYLYEQRDTFFSPNLDTVYKVQISLSDSCIKASYYTFTSNGEATVHFPCNTTLDSVIGTWSLAANNRLTVSIPYRTYLTFEFGFPSYLCCPLILNSINNTEFITNYKMPLYNIGGSIGIHSITMIYRHR